MLVERPADSLLPLSSMTIGLYPIRGEQSASTMYVGTVLDVDDASISLAKYPQRYPGLLL